MLPQVPLIVLPDWVTLLATSTPMYSGTVSGGFPLLPGRAVKLVPHSSGGLICGRVTPDAKPLNEDGAWPPERDRKSTRLNSSHSSISYAVFCLKKKTKK